MKKINALMATVALTVTVASPTIAVAEESNQENTTELNENNTQNTTETTQNQTETKTDEENTDKTEEAQVLMPSIVGETGVSIDARSGEVYFDKGAHQKSYPASVTKILTAILLDEHVKDGEMMKASAVAVGQEASNSHFKLEEGEEISKEDAMHALLLLSANDVAWTIAEHIGGSSEGFAKMMNEEMEKLGLKDSNFVTPNGLHDDNHYTTPYDMAMVAKEILENHPNVLKVMGTKTAKIHPTKHEETEITNPSKIHDNPIALGGKTGFTNMARNTLVEILEKDDKQVIAVTMKSTVYEEYNDIEKMGQYAFDKMPQYLELYKKNKVIETVEINGVKVGLKINHDLYVKADDKTDLLDVKKEVTKNKDIKDVKEGDLIGKVEIKIKDKVVGQANLYATKDAAEIETAEKEAKNHKKEEDGFNVWKFIVSIAVPLAVYGMFNYVTNNKNNRKRKK